jgi:rhodanese-related sulfurtransferase
MAMDPQERYAAAETERSTCVGTIVNSATRNKIVVAGPGTGKTFLFKKILQGKKRALTLIETEIDKIAAERRSKFSVLVISPTGTQARTIASALREKGFENVAYVDRPERDVTMLDGL